MEDIQKMIQEISQDVINTALLIAKEMTASKAEESSEIQGEQARIQGQRNSFLMSLLVLSAAIIRVDRKASYEEIIKQPMRK